MKYVILLLILSAVAASAGNTGSISGLVTDINGNPVNGALVAVKGVNLFAMSNEDGYYVYRNSQQIADLKPNSAVYVDLYAVDSGESLTYAIEAYNNLGRSEQINFSVKCD